MGLDMYLEADRWIGGQYEHCGITGKIEIDQQKTEYDREAREYKFVGEKKPLLHTEDMSRIASITFRIGYWRKANAIHAWFVDNVQDGVDECQRSYVEREQLESLLESCKTIVEEIEAFPVRKVQVKNGERMVGGSWEACYEEHETFDIPEDYVPSLTPTSGFFFGSTDINMWYYQDMKDTVEQLTEVLEDKELERCDFYYQSSW